MTKSILTLYDSLETSLERLSKNPYFMPVLLGSIIVLYLGTLAGHTGVCKVAGVSEAVSIFEPKSQPQHPVCQYLLNPLLLITGLLLIFFVPGYAWVAALFDQEEIDAIERFTISFAVSIALIILSILYLNMLFKIKITQIMVIADIIFITIIGISYWGWKKMNWFSSAKPAN